VASETARLVLHRVEGGAVKVFALTARLPLLRVCLFRIAHCLSWQHGLNDFYMPYKIQVQRSTPDKIAALERQVKELSTKTVQREQAEEAPMMNPGLGMLMITQGPGTGMPPQPYMNGNAAPPQFTGYRSF